MWLNPSIKKGRKRDSTPRKVYIVLALKWKLKYNQSILKMAEYTQCIDPKAVDPQIVVSGNISFFSNFTQTLEIDLRKSSSFPERPTFVSSMIYGSARENC